MLCSCNPKVNPGGWAPASVLRAIARENTPNSSNASPRMFKRRPAVRLFSFEQHQASHSLKKATISAYKLNRIARLFKICFSLLPGCSIYISSLLSDSIEETPYSQISTITHNKELLCPSALDTLQKLFKPYHTDWTAAVHQHQKWYKVCKSTFEKYKHTKKNQHSLFSFKRPCLFFPKWPAALVLLKCFTFLYIYEVWLWSWWDIYCKLDALI